MPSPDISSSVERIPQNVSYQALGGDLPNQTCSADRIRRQFYIVITKPLKSLAHAPQFTEFAEHQAYGFGNPPVRMQHYSASSVSRIPNRKPFEQLTTACFRFL